jgi:hypothetical protein
VIGGHAAFPEPSLTLTLYPNVNSGTDDPANACRVFTFPDFVTFLRISCIK